MIGERVPAELLQHALAQAAAAGGTPQLDPVVRLGDAIRRSLHGHPAARDLMTVPF